MVSFQRMKDDLDDLGVQVSQKLPAVGRAGCVCIALVVLAVLLGVAFAIGYSARGGGAVTEAGRAEALLQYSGGENASVHYVFVSNGTSSCPELTGDRLITTMKRGHSFEGLVVNLACRGDYNAYPNQVKCQRRSGSSELEWSHVPVCYPSLLVSMEYWSQTLHARSVSCSGDAASGTKCALTCIRDYIAVEANGGYSCPTMPCPAWSLGKANCYMCDQKCDAMHSVVNPSSNALLQKLGCEISCDKVLVLSDDAASVWQSKRTGLFSFLGEHNGRPVYQNNATKEFLFFTLTSSEWLVGPDFRKAHAGIQLYGNDDTSCPERSGGKNVSRLYIDSSLDSAGGTGTWTEDKSLRFECMKEGYSPVRCTCDTYKVYHLVYANSTSAPPAVEFLMGDFLRIDEKEYGLLAPLYRDPVKDLYLFSHHPKGRVWQISTKLTSTPMRATFPKDDSCPDDSGVVFEWFNTTSPTGQQLYVQDHNVKIKCVDSLHGR